MRRLLLVVALTGAGCGDDGGAGAPDAEPAPDGEVAPDADGGCPRAPAAADRARKVVVSHPYDADGEGANVYRVLDLAEDGALSDPGVTFELGRSTLGEIAFTPDGEVGLVAQEDGTLGVFRLDGEAPVVVHAAFAGGFYAAEVVVDPRGDVAYVLDTQWRENGGGIHRVAIGCDGALTDLGRWQASKLPAALHLLDGAALVAAADWDGSAAGQDAHLLAWDGAPAWVAGADAFGDDDAIVGGTAVTPDGAYFLIGDTSQFSGVPNRIAVVRVGATSLAPAQVISPVEDPLTLVPSPHGDVVLAVSGFGDAVFVLDYDPTAQAPFANRGEMAYSGAAPQLPAGAVTIDRGALRGLVLLAENVGVRRIRMPGDGVVTDLGLFSLGEGLDAITGTIGVQP